MVQSTNDNVPFSGVRVVVVEDDPLMAMDLEDDLGRGGAVVVGPCQTLDEAMARMDADDFAVRCSISVLGGYGVAGRAPAGQPRRSVRSLHWKVEPRPEPCRVGLLIVEKPASPRALVSAVERCSDACSSPAKGRR